MELARTWQSGGLRILKSWHERGMLACCMLAVFLAAPTAEMALPCTLTVLPGSEEIVWKVPLAKSY